MTITDTKKGIKVEVQTSISSTSYQVSGYELAAIIGQYMAKHDITDEQFINQFFTESK